MENLFQLGSQQPRAPTVGSPSLFFPLFPSFSLLSPLLTGLSTVLLLRVSTCVSRYSFATSSRSHRRLSLLPFPTIRRSFSDFLRSLIIILDVRGSGTRRQEVTLRLKASWRFSSGGMTKNIERRRSSKNERSSRGYITRSVDPMAEGEGGEGGWTFDWGTKKISRRK